MLEHAGARWSTLEHTGAHWSKQEHIGMHTGARAGITGVRVKARDAISSDAITCVVQVQSMQASVMLWP